MVSGRRKWASGRCRKCEKHSDALSYYERICPECRVWGSLSAYRTTAPAYNTGTPARCPDCRTHLEFLYGQSGCHRSSYDGLRCVSVVSIVYCHKCDHFLRLDGPLVGAPYRTITDTR